MSNWIRIDNDTYIDDSLVTCAEYQLFIDEMRAQKKYYQPDHWREYHFPKDHAREPVLGMRPSAAAAFCKWLTGYKNDGWLYRIPTQQEAQEYPLTKHHPQSIGHWVSKDEGDEKFVWIGIKPDNLRVFDLDFISSITHDIARDIASDCDYAVGQALASAIDLASSLNLTSEVTKASNSIQNNDLALAKEISIAIAISRPRDIELADNRARNMNRIIDVASTLDRIHASVTILERALGSVSTHTRPNEIANTSKIARDLVSAITSIRDVANTNARTPDSNINQAGANALKLSNNLKTYIITILQRMDGTSPAFEGIRLVRERIK
ncbi:MAG: SUMF1/EgtB/PvdO family nonheme iron enzyme [Anaerolineales bacterium]|jgi:hypothetical protein|nr:SUMF1/EgtB/PvdO family nonheme iron enzyme [Anaerolineales bacterium]